MSGPQITNLVEINILRNIKQKLSYVKSSDHKLIGN